MSAERLQNAASRLGGWRQISRIVLAVVGACLVFAWAAYLLYWAFVEEHPRTQVTREDQLYVLVVALVPPVATIVGLLGTFNFTSRAALLMWTGVITVCLFVFSPGLFGAGYMLAAPLMLVSAVLASDRRGSLTANAPLSEDSR